MNEHSRLRRWRKRARVQSEHLAVLIGVSNADLLAYEGGAAMPLEDREALRIIFDDRFPTNVLLSRDVGGLEDTLLDRMDDAFRATLERWRKSA